MEAPPCECHGEPKYWRKDRRKRSGGYWYCAVRERERMRARRAEDPESVRKYERDWKRNRYAADPEFRKLLRKRAAAPEYRARARELRQARYANDPDYRTRQIDRSSARAAKLRGSPVAEPISRRDIYDRDGGRCHICGKHVPLTAFHLDHLIPLSRGGEHVLENVRVAHPFCNLSRGPGREPAQLLLVG